MADYKKQIDIKISTNADKTAKAVANIDNNLAKLIKSSKKIDQLGKQFDKASKNADNLKNTLSRVNKAYLSQIQSTRSYNTATQRTQKYIAELQVGISKMEAQLASGKGIKEARSNLKAYQYQLTDARVELEANKLADKDYMNLMQQEIFQKRIQGLNNYSAQAIKQVDKVINAELKLQKVMSSFTPHQMRTDKGVGIEIQATKDALAQQIKIHKELQSVKKEENNIEEKNIKIKRSILQLSKTQQAIYSGVASKMGQLKTINEANIKTVRELVTAEKKLELTAKAVAKGQRPFTSYIEAEATVKRLTGEFNNLTGAISKSSHTGIQLTNVQKQLYGGVASKLRELKVVNEGNVKVVRDLTAAEMKLNNVTKLVAKNKLPLANYTSARAEVNRLSTTFDKLKDKTAKTKLDQGMSRTVKDSELISKNFKFVYTYWKAMTVMRIGKALINFVEGPATELRDMQNLMMTTAKDAGEMGKNLEAVYQIAQRTRSSFSATSNLFSKMMLANDTLRLSTADVLDLTERITKSFIASGASAGEAASATLQIGQALSKGIVNGDELRSILENNAQLGLALSDYLGVSRGQLTKMGAAGKITSDVLAKAVLSSERITDAFAKTSPTISQASQQLSNAFLKLAGMQSEARGLNGVIIQLYQNMTEWMSSNQAKGMYNLFADVTKSVLDLLPAMTLLGEAFIGFQAAKALKGIKALPSHLFAVQKAALESSTKMEVFNKLLDAGKYGEANASLGRLGLQFRKLGMGMKSAYIAAQALKGALLTIGITAVVVGIGELVSHLYESSAEMEANKESTFNLAKTYSGLTDNLYATRDASTAAMEALVKLDKTEQRRVRNTAEQNLADLKAKDTLGSLNKGLKSQYALMKSIAGTGITASSLTAPKGLLGMSGGDKAVVKSPVAYLVEQLKEDYTSLQGPAFKEASDRVGSLTKAFFDTYGSDITDSSKVPVTALHKFVSDVTAITDENPLPDDFLDKFLSPFKEAAHLRETLENTNEVIKKGNDVVKSELAKRKAIGEGYKSTIVASLTQEQEKIRIASLKEAKGNLKLADALYRLKTAEADQETALKKVAQAYTDLENASGAPRDAQEHLNQALQDALSVLQQTGSAITQYTTDVDKIKGAADRSSDALEKLLSKVQKLAGTDTTAKFRVTGFESIPEIQGMISQRKAGLEDLATMQGRLQKQISESLASGAPVSETEVASMQARYEEIKTKISKVTGEVNTLTAAQKKQLNTIGNRQLEEIKNINSLSGGYRELTTSAQSYAQVGTRLKELGDSIKETTQGIALAEGKDPAKVAELTTQLNAQKNTYLEVLATQREQKATLDDQISAMKILNKTSIEQRDQNVQIARESALTRNMLVEQLALEERIAQVKASGKVGDGIEKQLADLGYEYDQLTERMSYMKDLGQEVQSAVGKSFSGMFQAIKDGTSVLDSVEGAFRNMADNIVNYFLEQQLPSMLFGGLLGGGAGIFGGSTGLLGGLFGSIGSFLGFHTGGVVGKDSPTFTRSTPKYHTGGLIGAGEEAAILKRGEAVFTPGQLKALPSVVGNQGATTEPKIVINNYASSDTEVQTSTYRDQKGFETAVIDIIQRKKRQVGSIINSSNVARAQ